MRDDMIERTLERGDLQLRNRAREEAKAWRRKRDVEIWEQIEANHLRAQADALESKIGTRVTSKEINGYLMREWTRLTGGPLRNLERLAHNAGFTSVSALRTAIRNNADEEKAA